MYTRWHQDQILKPTLLEISKYIAEAKKLGADLIVLPENFSMMAKKDSIYLRDKRRFRMRKNTRFYK